MKIGEVSLLTNDVVRLADFYKKLLEIDNDSEDTVHQTLIANTVYLRTFPERTPERSTAGSDEMKTNYPAGWLTDIGFVVIFANYQGKWVYSWHKRRGSFEHPGGHVEQGETAMEAARRELYEETGITDCDMMPLWDYEQRWGDGVGKSNGRVFYAKVRSLGTMTESEMSHIELFESVPENYTYDSEEEARDLERIGSILQAFE